MALKKRHEVFQFPGCQEEWHIIILTLSRLFHSDCPFRKQIQETTWQLLHLYGGFLKWGYSQIIRFNMIFHEINHPATGVPPFWETPMEDVVPQPSSWPAPTPNQVGVHWEGIPSPISNISINHTFINPACTTNSRSNRAPCRSYIRV